MMYHHLQQDILTNDINYFFSLIGPRFDLATKLMANALQRKFGTSFEPIYVYSARPNQHFVKDNFIVLNGHADRIEESAGDKVIYLQEFEDLNVEFVESDFIKDLGNKLLKKQDKIFVYPFTTSFLDIEHPDWIVLGPNSKIVKRYDNKVEQYILFTELNVPRNKANVFSSQTALEDALLSNLPCYVTASYASGGNESGLVYSPDMLNKLFSGLRSPNKQDRFLVSEVFEGLKIAPNASGIVTGRDKTHLLVISDQILAGTRYLGNVYPSAVPPSIANQIQEIMVSVGNRLSADGYRGFFGCDFLVNSAGHLVTVDLNPRRQGGYLCNTLALKSSGVDLIAMELDCVLDGDSDVELDYSIIQYPRAWAHSKVKPVGPGQRICAELCENTPDQVFESELPEAYAATFYEPNCMFLDGYVGYVVTVGHDRTRVLQELRVQTERLLSQALYTVSGGSESAEIAGKAKSGRDFRGADLRGIDLRRIYLQGSNLLREADLRGVNLSGKDLSGADLRGANLVGANLEEADLKGANLEQAQLQGVSLRKAILQGAKLKRAHLRGANLELANLEEADLCSANLKEATIRDANLKAANLKGTSLTQVNLKGAKLKGACLEAAHLEGADLQRTNLAGVVLIQAHLEGANLGMVNLKGACLRQAHLARADLIGAHLEGANLEEANLEGARLNNAHLDKANLRDAHLQGARLAQAHLENANLKGADLLQAELAMANLEGANLEGANLASAHLESTNLTQANLSCARLDGAYLGNAILARANLKGASLHMANVVGANLEGANLELSNFSYANLAMANLEGTNLEGANLKGAHLD